MPTLLQLRLFSESGRTRGKCYPGLLSHVRTSLKPESSTGVRPSKPQGIATSTTSRTHRYPQFLFRETVYPPWEFRKPCIGVQAKMSAFCCANDGSPAKSSSVYSSRMSCRWPARCWTSMQAHVLNVCTKGRPCTPMPSRLAALAT